MNKELQKYITDHITPEKPVLEELYRQTHLRFVNPNMVSGHQQGMLLEFVSRMINPMNILEIGTFTGYSAICLAAGLKKGGKLITIEINDEIATFTRSYFDKAGVADRIELLNGNALEIIPGLDITFDLVFIDADKRDYSNYYRLAFEKLNPGGFILADNVLWGGQVIEKETKDQQARGIIEFNEMIRKGEGIENIILPFRDGLMIIRKKYPDE
ncbi:MAG TPA: O-methyltransferase [Bacteroidales bacterium]|nr:O-methyltransferase [Bacteroidales bacterium]